MVAAVRVHKVGGPEVLTYEDIAVAAPGAGQLRVKQHAIGVNFVDCYFRSGLYPAPGGLPFVAGNHGVLGRVSRVMRVAEPPEVDGQAGAVVEVKDKAVLLRQRVAGNQQDFAAHAQAEEQPTLAGLDEDPLAAPGHVEQPGPIQRRDEGNRLLGYCRFEAKDSECAVR